MHTFEFQRNLNIFLAELKDCQAFTTTLSALAQSAEAMEEHLRGIATGGDRVHKAALQIHTHLENVRKTTSIINQRHFFKALEHFQRSIAQLQLANHRENDLISSLNSKVDEFANIYDAFISNQSSEDALPMLMAARVLHVKLTTLFDSLQLIEEIMGAYDIPGNSEAPLTILLPAHLEILEFANKLLAIQRLYSELCMLFSVSESSNPLRISKIESGSLWVKVFGESNVIGMMASFIERTASWVYRTYTIEGKIDSVPRKVEAIDALLKLSERLRQNGIDPSAMNEHIDKAAVEISKSLAQILNGQSIITVNDQTISVGSELNKKLLEGNVPLKLLSSIQRDEDKMSEIPKLE